MLSGLFRGLPNASYAWGPATPPDPILAVKLTCHFLRVLLEFITEICVLQVQVVLLQRGRILEGSRKRGVQVGLVFNKIRLFRGDYGLSPDFRGAILGNQILQPVLGLQDAYLLRGSQKLRAVPESRGWP